MNWLEAIVLGLIQGLTEFLPVSSSGHLEIAKALFGINPEESFYFTVAVHGATVLSTLVVFRREIIRLITGALKFKMNEETSYIIKILVSLIPVGIAGILFMDYIQVFYSGRIIFVGIMLIITALLLAAAHFTKKKDRPVGYWDALIIGIAQTIAVIPGISRSGATISTGLILGNSKNEVAKFSFLMVLIPVIGANFLEIVSGEAVTGNAGAGVILTGFLTAFISGYLACRWMITLVKKSKLIWFSVYCFAAGILTVILG